MTHFLKFVGLIALMSVFNHFGLWYVTACIGICALWKVTE